MSFEKLKERPIHQDMEQYLYSIGCRCIRSDTSSDGRIQYDWFLNKGRTVILQSWLYVDGFEIYTPSETLEVDAIKEETRLYFEGR